MEPAEPTELGEPAVPAFPGAATPTVITPCHALTDTMADPATTPFNVSDQRGNPVAALYARTVVPNPITATLRPVAA
jgi:hypothetical protein